MQRKCFLEFAKQNYKKGNDIQQIIHCNGINYKLIFTNETLKVYLDKINKNIIISFRGTQTFRDVVADVKIGLNLLHKSKRFIEDENSILKNVFSIYDPMEYDYYVTGHSLGGSLANIFRKKYNLFIRGGITFNSAFQPMSLINQDSEIKKLYISDDPLYRNGGYLYRNKKVFNYKPNRINGFFNFAKKVFFPNTLGRLNTDAHKLTNFNNRNLEGNGMNFESYFMSEILKFN